jgi:hypothetical protein
LPGWCAAQAILLILSAAIPALADSTRVDGLPGERFWEVVHLDAGMLDSLHGVPQHELALFACQQECKVIPWQLDERDPSGSLVLDQGPERGFDDPPGLLDENDDVLFMAVDAGRRLERSGGDVGWHAKAIRGFEIEVYDPRSGRRVWAYLLQFAGAAPRAAGSYVQYSPEQDRVRTTGVVLGFERGIPRFLALASSDAAVPENLLDRMKIRASARFLWGLLTLRRDEDDIEARLAAWRQGPIRAIRRQYLWVRLAFGFRTPILGSDTLVYRDFAELPVNLRLNFPPRLLFSDVSLRAALDFRNLSGWELESAHQRGRLRIDGRMTADKRALSHQPGEWFALRAPGATLLQMLSVSPSLRTVRRRLYYRESAEAADPPESQPGEMPGVGYALTDWKRVNSGHHSFTSTSYALPAEIDVAEFMEVLRQPLRTEIARFEPG